MQQKLIAWLVSCFWVLARWIAHGMMARLTV